jgi:predicted dehydrogenase
MQLDKVRVGVVGLGLVCESHIKGYQACPDAEVVAVCDLDAARAKSVADKFGVKKHYTAFAKMLEDDSINTIDIATPTYLHAPMVTAAARAGKNVLCEKPFCLTLAEGLAACEEAAKHDVALMVGESYIFMTSIMKARELIDAGEIGKPQQIRQRFGAWVERAGVFDVDRPITDAHRGWRMDTTKAGGAGFPWMFDHCVHFFATAEYLMQGLRIKQVYSQKSDISWMHEERQTTDRSEVDLYRPERADDIPLMMWSYEDPACQGVWMRAEPLNGKYDPMYGFSVSVSGDEGMIEVLGEGGRGLQWLGKDAHLVLHRKGKETLALRFDEGGDDIWQSEVSYYSRAHRNQIREFVAALTSGNAPRYTGVDGRRAVQTTMAAICSAREGVAVDVAEATDERMRR